MKEYIEIQDTKLFLNKNDAVVSGAISLNIYENKFFKTLISEISEDMVFIDVGANIGLYCCPASKKLFPKGIVVAIEPDPENFSFLNKNKNINGLENLLIHQLAVADFCGSGSLFLNSENRGDHRIYDEDEKRIEIKVKIITLDKLLLTNGIKNVDIVKIDTQGADFKVLKGMQKTIHENPNLSIFIEFWPWGLLSAGDDPKLMIEFIKEKKFRIFNAETKKLINLKVLSNMIAHNRERDHINLILKR